MAKFLAQTGGEPTNQGQLDCSVQAGSRISAHVDEELRLHLLTSATINPGL
jgi:hypothetical protein